MSKCEQCIVRQLSSLKALTKDELVAMSECKTSQTVKKGTVIFKEGEYLHGVYCIKQGACKLTKLSPNGKEQILKFISRGDLLGQRSVLSNEAVNLTATAVNDMEVCFIPKAEIVNALAKNVRFSKEMIKDVCDDLKEANDAVVNMAQHNVKQRLAEALLYLYDTFGINDDGVLNIQLSREEMANMVGTATESAIRLLSSFKKEGLIAFEGKKIKLLDIKKLEYLINE